MKILLSLAIVIVAVLMTVSILDTDRLSPKANKNNENKVMNSGITKAL